VRQHDVVTRAPHLPWPARGRSGRAIGFLRRECVARPVSRLGV
jgi:hypothetical protein